MLIQNHSNTHQSFRQEKLSHNQNKSLFIDRALENFGLSSAGHHLGIGHIMANFLWRDLVKKNKHVSIEALSKTKSIKLSKRQVIRHIKQLEQQDFISVIRKPKQTNTYFINPLFYDSEVRIALQHLFPELNDSKQKRRQQEVQILLDNLVVFNTKEKLSDTNFSPGEKQKMSPYLIGNIYRETYVEEYPKLLSFYEYEPDWLGQDWSGLVFKKELKEEDGSDFSDLFSLPDQLPVLPPVLLKPDPTTLKKEMLMKKYELKSIKLTDYGQIRLIPFPEEAIKTIDDQIYHMTNRPSKPWNYFISACKRYCEENHLVMDWYGLQKAVAANPLVDNGPFIDESFIPSRPVFSKTRPKTSSPNKPRDPEKILDSNMKETLFNQQSKARNAKRFEEEREWLRINDPETFEHRARYAWQLRLMIGANEDGTFSNLEDKKKAVEILTKSEKRLWQ
jgi:hypothetical protein